MLSSLLLSEDLMPSYPILTSAPKQLQLRTLPGTQSTSRATTDKDITNWLSQQEPRQSFTQHHTMPRNMSHINTSFPHPHTHLEAEEYTITTHAPNDHASLVSNRYMNWDPMQPDMQQGSGMSGLSIQQNGFPSPATLPDSEWSDLSPYLTSPASLEVTQPPYYMGNYSHESLNNTLNHFAHQVPSSGSDPSLSPLYPSSPRLPTPTTPGSPYPLGQSPSISDMSLIVPDRDSTSSASDRERYTHRQQLQFFREALRLPMDGAGPFVPQPMYKPHTTSDRKRYVEEVLLEAPLFFYSDHPTQCGILLKDALQSRTKKLRDRDQVVFEGRGPSVSIRLEWPGYRQWSRQIPTKDFRSPPGPITLAKLAKNVAKCVQRFMIDRKSLPLEEESDPRWRIGDGPDDIKLEDLVLVSIHHVSLGSWQPHLRLVRPRPARLGNHGPLPPTPISTTHASPAGMPYTHLSS